MYNNVSKWGLKIKKVHSSSVTLTWQKKITAFMFDGKFSHRRTTKQKFEMFGAFSQFLLHLVHWRLQIYRCIVFYCIRIFNISLNISLTFAISRVGQFNKKKRLKFKKKIESSYLNLTQSKPRRQKFWFSFCFQFLFIQIGSIIWALHLKNCLNESTI